MKPVIRASSVDQLLRCHASHKLAANIPSKSGSEANDGTYIHWQTGRELVMSHGAEEGSDFNDPSFPVGYEFPIKDSWVIDACVRNAIFNVPDDWSMIVEDELAWEYDNFILVGHADLIGLSPDADGAIIRDWKTGAVFVDPAEYNYQVMAYAILTWRSWPTIDMMKFGLYQPRAFIGEDSERESEDIIVGQKEFIAAENFLENKINEALKHWYILQTGPKQCRWCPAFDSLVCPGIKQEIDNMKMQITEHHIRKASVGCDDETLAELLHATKILKPRLGDIEDEAKKRIGKGSELIHEGKQFKVQTSSNGKKIQDMQAFMDNIEPIIGTEKLREISSVGMGAAQDAIAKELDIPKYSKVEGKDNAKSRIEESNVGNLLAAQKEIIIAVDVEDEDE